jgi:hypothetical protein
MSLVLAIGDAIIGDGGRIHCPAALFTTRRRNRNIPVVGQTTATQGDTAILAKTGVEAFVVARTAIRTALADNFRLAGEDAKHRLGSRVLHDVIQVFSPCPGLGLGLTQFSYRERCPDVAGKSGSKVGFFQKMILCCSFRDRQSAASRSDCESVPHAAE